MTTAEYLIAFATFFGPVAAVQAQKWIERTREERGRKQSIFYTLLSTRALRAASSEHVQALNSIDIFFDINKKKDKPVTDAWNEYLDHLNHYPEGSPQEVIAQWDARGETYLVALLQAIGQNLGRSFTSVQLRRGIYYPRGHSDTVAAQIALRDMVAKLAKNEWAIPMAVREFPVSDDALRMQTLVQQALLNVLSGEHAVKVNVESEAVASTPRATV